MKKDNKVNMQLEYLALMERETSPESIRKLAENAKMPRAYVSDLLFNYDIDMYIKLNKFINDAQASLKDVAVIRSGICFQKALAITSSLTR